LVKKFHAKTVKSVAFLNVLGWLRPVFEQRYMANPLVMSLMVMAVIRYKRHTVVVAMAILKRD
jgi:hypothetical protein